MLKFWRIHSNQNQPYNQPAASPNQILGAIDSTPDDLETQFTLALQWSTAARIGDILPLRRENINWNPTTLELSVKIDEGKVMAKTGPYTVHTLANQEFVHIFNTFLATRTKPKERLFSYEATPRSTRVSRVNSALKASASDLTTRSIRRGALQTMALKGVSIATLRQFSGHRSDDTCKRYLDWGRLAHDIKNNAQDAAKYLRIVTSSN
jgi:integrase